MALCIKKIALKLVKFLRVKCIILKIFLFYSEAEVLINTPSSDHPMRILYRLSEKLKRRRYGAGALMLDSDARLSEYKSHSLIEQFMILANHTVARFLGDISL